jgi:protein CrcB
MLTYLYIVIGGAVGTLARAGMTNAMIRAVGPQFPWGTILINVLGSFIIGFFGALTASDGRFTVHSDVRAFVMVGFCGGYTTFSSFSLQTLDLARDGKLGAAFANISLSLVLCLSAVTAGYASAVVLNRNATETRTSDEKSIADVVLAVLDQPETVGGVLSSAARLLDFGGGGRIEALAVRTPPIAEIMIADQVLTPFEEAKLRAGEHAWAGGVKAIVDQWGHQSKTNSVETDWIDVEGDVAHLVAQHGRVAESVVVARALKAGRSREALHAAIFDTDRPVLMVPFQNVRTFGRIVAVAWKDDERAPKAVLAAMPILAKAEIVHVLQAGINGAQSKIPPIIREHGIAAHLHLAPDQDGPVGEQILALAKELGADLLVMGAYAHGEWREALLGGVTRHMLDHADLPILMRH